MGIYDIYIGKGIIVPVKIFVKKYLKYIPKNCDEYDDEDIRKLFDKIIKRRLGQSFELSSLGHDALVSRDGEIGTIRRIVPPRPILRIGRDSS